MQNIEHELATFRRASLFRKLVPSEQQRPIKVVNLLNHHELWDQTKRELAYGIIGVNEFFFKFASHHITTTIKLPLSSPDHKA